jgi:hypothetical protein
MASIAAVTPAALPVPGLEPWWFPLIGRTRRRITRNYAAALADMLHGVRYGADATVTVNLTLPPRLTGRCNRRLDTVRRYVGLAVVTSAELNAGFFADLERSQVRITIAIDAYADRNWGDAFVVVEWRERPVIR